MTCPPLLKLQIRISNYSPAISTRKSHQYLKLTVSHKELLSPPNLAPPLFPTTATAPPPTQAPQTKLDILMSSLFCSLLMHQSQQKVRCWNKFISLLSLGTGISPAKHHRLGCGLLQSPADGTRCFRSCCPTNDSPWNGHSKCLKTSITQCNTVF